MKEVPDKELPAVSGGVKPGDMGDCLPEPYPKFPMVPVLPPDPEFTDPLDV
jgi:hypothetical protein